MSIKDERINHILNQWIEIDGRIWTRREWLDYQHSAYGREVIVTTKPKYKFSRRKYNSLCGEEQKQYEAKTDITVPAYLLDSVFLNKIELDYYKSLGNPTPAVIDQAEYQEIMEDPKLKSIVRQLKEIDDEEEWWLLAESLKAFCSREEIDLIDTVNGWNIND